MVVGIAAVLFCQNVRLTLVAVGVAPILAAVNHVGGRRLAAHASAVKTAESRLASHVDRATDAPAAAWPQLAGDVPDPHADATAMTIGAWRAQSWTQLSLNVLVGTTQGLGAAAVLAYGGWLVHRGDAGLSVGDLTLFLSYVAMLWGPLGTLTGLAASLAGGAAGARRVFETLDAQFAPAPRPATTGGERAIAA